RLGELRTPMRPNGRRLHAHYFLPAVPRGRYPYRFARAVLEDPFGLERAEVDLGAGGALLVYPRLVDLDRVFSDAGARTPDGGRRPVLLVRSALAESRRIHSSDGDWRGAMELLAAVEPTASVPLAALLAADESSASRALELTVVTARLAPELVDQLVRRSLGR